MHARKNTIIAGAIPLGILASFYLFATIVRVSMGGLPDPGSVPQPPFTWDIISTLSILMLYPLSLIALLGLALSSFALLGLSVTARWRSFLAQLSPFCVLAALPWRIV